MANVYYAVSPHLDVSVLQYTSQEAQVFKASKVTNDLAPKLAWRSDGMTVDQEITLSAFPSTPTGIFVNRTNYPECKFWKAASQLDIDSASWLEGSPNVLLWSDQPRRHASGNGLPESPWSYSGSGSCVVDQTSCPDPNDTSMYAILSVSGHYISQSVNFGASRSNVPVVFSVWLKAAGTSDVGDTVRLSVVSSNTISKDITLTADWKRYEVSGTVATSAQTSAQIRIIAQGAATNVSMWRAQMTFDATAHVGADYETESKGVIIPNDDRVDRRKGLFLFGDSLSSHDYMRYQIPASQTADDSENYYSTGSITPSSTLAEFPGKHIMPIQLGIDQEEVDTRFEGASREVLSLGDPYVTLQVLGGAHLAEEAMVAINKISRLAPGRTIILYENLPVPGGEPLTRNISRAYLMRRVKSSSNQTFQIAHVVDYRPAEFMEVL